MLAMYQIPLDRFIKMWSVVSQANQKFYQLNQQNERFYKILTTSTLMLKSHPLFKKMSLKEQAEWGKIRNRKTGDRAYITRMLESFIKFDYPDLYNELIYKSQKVQSSGDTLEFMDLSDDMDTLLMVRNIPAFIKYLNNLNKYKEGIFSPIKRNYVGFIQMRGLNLISQFLKAFEDDLSLMEPALMGDLHLNSWQETGMIFGSFCERADSNHHDSLDLDSINCLRSIYISIFNLSMQQLISQNKTLVEVQKFLPVIPDLLDFSRNRLEYDNAWKRYQEHLFLFMRLPKEKKSVLMEKIRMLTPVQRVVWMGCLGKTEIHALVLPMISPTDRFENLTRACLSVSRGDSDVAILGSRVRDVLSNIYYHRLKGKDSTPDSLRELYQDNLVPPEEKAENSEIQKRTTQISDEVATLKGDLISLKKLSFLVVDDSEKIRRMTMKVLIDAGVNDISEAINGEDAWDVIQKREFDVILCDWLMPELSGIELVQRINQVEKIALRTVFLMLTTVDDKASIVEALSVGVRGYLIKPFTRKQLLDKVLFATEWLGREDH